MMILPLLAAFLTAFLSAPLLRQVAVRWAILDHPEIRKLQKEPIPLLGGVAVFLGTLLGIVLSGIYAVQVLQLLAGATVIFLVSLIDDKKDLSAHVRIFFQFLAASILIFSGLRISFFPPGLLGDAAEILVTYIWILGITNAFNYLDGLDGLCTGLAVVAAVFFSTVLFSTGQGQLLFLPLTLMAACLGFMPHNLKNKKMFLGDAGSMFIGFMMAGIALVGDWASDDIVKISVPILILGVPIFDMTFTTVMRYRENKIHTVVEWLEYAGRDHFHHYLMDLGLHQHGAVLFILAVNIFMGLNAFIISRARRPMTGVLGVVEGGIMFGLIAVLMVLGRRLHKEQQVKERLGI